MPEMLLRTKLYVPPLRPNLVSRPRLIERLDQGLQLGAKLTLISAPAGFGKTTLASEWVGSLRLHAVKESQTKYQASWLSLDENDNDLARFLTYFIAALNQNEGFESPLGEGVLSVLQSSQSAPTEAFLTSLINEITAIPNRMIFVLDDYHVISSSEVDEALIFLLEHLPQQLHLAVVTRKDPNLPFARLRARGQLTELRAIDLRFSTSEAAKFFNEIMSLNLAEEDITALDSQTEGWIAGLQLAAISMQGQKDTTRLIKSFTGSHRFVLDYLIEEVLNQQHVSVQTFLLQTAILRRLTGSLCDALTGEDNGQETLERLEHANLFIIPLDEERRWYRYHHLFAELLQQRLKHTYPNLIRDLHSKAAGWHETNGDFHEAIHHAIAMDDTKTATRLIEKGALEALERSDLRFILNWVDRLPDTALESSPWLFLYHTWALLISGQVDVAASRLENTEWILELNSADESRKQEMFGYIAGSKALLCLWQRDYENGINLANQALEKLPENHWVRGYCAIVLGGTFAGVGNLGEAISAFVESSSVGKASGNKLLEVSSACNHAYVLELEGRLQQAIKIYQDAFLITERDGSEIPVAGYIYIDLARVLYELDELGLASQHLKKGIKLCQQLMDGRAEKIGHCLLARVQLAQEDVVNALNSIKNAEKAYPGQETSFDLRGGEYPQIRLWLKEKNLKEVDAWIEESGASINNVLHFKTKLNSTMHARALIALGRAYPNGPYLNDAQDLLEKLLRLAENNGWVSKVIEILALQAMALEEEGDAVQARTKLERALILAEPEGFVRTFVDEGPAMAHLLRKARNHGIASTYIRQLLAAFPMDEPAQTDTTTSHADQSELVEPLSERELEVLQRIAEGLTNRQVADQLYLSLNTVKVHTRNIYGKLGVNNRTEAVARARDLGVLPRS